MPVHTIDETGSNHLGQYKPDHPRLDKKENPIKYETPTGTGLRIDCPPRCKKSLEDPKEPLYITEGLKKVDALASRGVCAIALLGVHGFQHKNQFKATTISIDLKYINKRSSNEKQKQALKRIASEYSDERNHDNVSGKSMRTGI